MGEKKILKNAKSKVKEIKRKYNNNWVDVPEIIKGKYNKYRLMSGLIAILGIVLSFALQQGFGIIGMCLVSILLGLMILTLAFVFRFNVTNTGFIIKKGKCINHHLSMNKIGKVNRLIVETNDEIIDIPITKVNEVAPINTWVKIYLSKNATKYKSDGISHYSNILAYELIPAKNTEKNSDYDEDIN